MGFGASGPEITTINPNTPSVQGVGNAAGGFFSQLFSGGVEGNPFANIGQGGLSGQAGNAIASTLGQNPLAGVQNQLGQILTGGAGQNIINTAQQGFQQNLSSALGSLSSAAPGRFNTALGAQGQGLAQNALRDFNLFSQQVMQQDVQNQLGAGGLLGNIANQNFQNLLGAGQFGLQQNLAGISPFLQLLGMGTQFGQQAPLESVVQPGSSGLGGFLGQLAGTALGSFAGPLGAGLGARLGGSLFGGNGGRGVVGVDQFIPGFGGIG